MIITEAIIIEEMVEIIIKILIEIANSRQNVNDTEQNIETEIPLRQSALHEKDSICKINAIKDLELEHQYFEEINKV